MDAWLLSEVVTPKLPPGQPGGRAMMMPEDITFVLGSDRALDCYKNEMKKTMRKSLPGALEAARKTLAKLPSTALEKSVYNEWLEALMYLSSPSTTKNFLEVLRTAAYHDRKIEAVLSGWAELRHDMVLMVEQSLGGSGCRYPKGYVEPVPEMFRALARAAKQFESAFGPKSRELHSWMFAEDGFFTHFVTTMETLARLSEKELAGAAFDEADKAFLNITVDMHLDSYSGERMYNGWYSRLYIDNNPSESKPIVTDVHTDAENRRVLQLGTGHPGLMIIAVDNGGDRTVYGGPVYNLHTFYQPLRARMTDQEWIRRIARDTFLFFNGPKGITVFDHRSGTLR